MLVEKLLGATAGFGLFTLADLSRILSLHLHTCSTYRLSAIVAGRAPRVPQQCHWVCRVACSPHNLAYFTIWPV